MKIKNFNSDTVFHFFNVLFALLIIFVTFYPLYWIVIASISDPTLINTGQIRFLPRDITFGGYKAIFEFERLWIGYRNVIIYTVLGTALSVSLTLTAGYALSRKDLVGRKYIMIMLTITMFFGGGLIPTYMLVRNLGMENTIFAMFVPSAVSAYNLIIAKTFFQSLPFELYEAAFIDGCTNVKYFLRIGLFLSGPLIAIMVLWSAVGQWNSYMPALIYLRNDDLYPLQLILREVLVLNDSTSLFQAPNDLAEALEQQKFAELVKYAIIIVSTAPILALYPFLQKYFVKGIMLGSIKG